MNDKLTIKEVMEKLNVTRQTVYNYIEKNYLTPIKMFNGRVLFDRTEVLRLLEPMDKLPFTELPEGEQK